MINEINFDCTVCGNKKADVQCKITTNQDKKLITLFRIKCLKCKRNYLLNDTDERCKKFFNHK